MQAWADAFDLPIQEEQGVLGHSVILRDYLIQIHGEGQVNYEIHQQIHFHFSELVWREVVVSVAGVPGADFQEKVIGSHEWEYRVHHQLPRHFLREGIDRLGHVSSDNARVKGDTVADQSG